MRLTHISHRLVPALLTATMLATVWTEISHSDTVVAVQMVLLVVSTGFCLPFTSGFARWFAVALLASSLLLLVSVRIPVAQVVAAGRNAGAVMSLNLLAEVLGGAVQVMGFDLRLTMVLARYARTPWSVRITVFVGSFLLTLTGLFVAAMTTVFYTIAAPARQRGLPLALSASRGFCAALMIFPFSPIVMVALNSSGAAISEYVRYALPISLLFVVLDWIPRRDEWTQIRTAATAIAGTPGETGASMPWPRLALPAFLASAATFGSLFVWLGELKVLSLVQVGAASAAAGLVLGMAEPRRWLAALPGLPAARFRPHLAAVPLFALGGWFGSLVVASGALEPAAVLIRQVNLPVLDVPLIVAAIVIFRWAGVAPVVGLLILGPVLVRAVSLPPSLYALALVVGAVAGFMGSPLSATTLFIAGATGTSPFRVVRSQLYFVLAAVAALTGYATIMRN